MTPPVAQNSFTVVVKKVDTSLGINVIQKGSGIFIKNLVPDGPASKSPRIRPGDQILAVNEHPLSGLSRMKAITVLRRAEGEVTLLLTRSSVTVANITAHVSLGKF